VTLYCATGNPGKLREFRLAAQRFGVEIPELPGLNEIPPCEETGRTFEENAILKATYYGQRAQGLMFADDSGLEVDSLGNAPGVLSARYAGPGATDAANNQLLLARMRGIDNRRARFVCVIALADRGKPVHTFRGVVEGQILDAARGSAGFGYDPLFYYPPLGRSFGEIAVEEKMAVSHRGKALTALFEFLTVTAPGHSRVGI
jgi:XTP/dITP diphosphohydrolase